MQKLAQSWLVYDLTQSAWFLGLDAFLGEIPIFMFSILGGVVADRKDRRWVLVISQMVQMFCAITLALLFFFKGKSVAVWQILLLSFVTGTAQAFGGPAYQALLPTLVKKEDLQNVIAMNSIQFNIARVIGPTLGGVTLAKLGAVWCFGINALSFFAVIATLLKLPARAPADSTKEPILQSMKVGINFIRNNAAMMSLVILAFLMTMLGIPLTVFLPVIAQKVFALGADAYSEMLVVSGIGAVMGGFFVAATSHTNRKGLIALVSILGLGLFTLGFSLSVNFYLSCALLFMASASLISCFGMVSSLVQTLAEDSMRGRVMSVYNVAFRGGMPFGSLAAGRLSEIWGAPAVLAANGVLLMLLSAYFLFAQRRVRDL